MRSTRNQLADARQIDRQVALLDRLREQTRDLGLSARRYMITLDLQHKQHFLAVADDLKNARKVLDARHLISGGPVLEADLDAYISGLTFQISDYEEDPVARLNRFEDKLVGVRAPLASVFDEMIARLRARREKLRSTQSLALGAQWTVGIAGLLGILIAVGGCISLLGAITRPQSGADPRQPGIDLEAGTQPRLLR
ncbi:MAG TPA: hypothetical protein VLB44_02855 [Kofleriaceae bacterium]|nr:hypothetical protein [Kofleriaceae bacterium]